MNIFLTKHSALKLEKNAISKVQKHIFCDFKNGKKSIFASEKKLKTNKNAIFGLGKPNFLTEIKLFFTFQVIVEEDHVNELLPQGDQV